MWIPHAHIRRRTCRIDIERVLFRLAEHTCFLCLLFDQSRKANRKPGVHGGHLDRSQSVDVDTQKADYLLYVDIARIVVPVVNV